LDKIQLHSSRENARDLRQQMILDAKASGQTKLIVAQWDSVDEITELKPDPGDWVNSCAAKYYGEKSIIAVEKYQRIPAYPIVN
jgi:hypothetical protein